LDLVILILDEAPENNSGAFLYFLLID